MTLLVWLAQQAPYWSLAIAVMAAWVVTAFRPSFLVRRLSIRAELVLFVALGALTIVAFRWPVFWNPRPLNIDEAQMAAQAIKAMADPLPWHGFDGATAGPFDSYVLALPALLGFHISIPLAHVAAAIMGIVATFTYFFGARRLFGEAIARATTVVPLLFFAAIEDVDFVPYSSELLPIVLMLATFAALTVLLDTPRPRVPALVAGITLGIVPFSKLQVMPIWLALLVVLAWALWRRRRFDRSDRGGVIFVSALAATIGTIVASTAITGSLNDAVIRYVLINLGYAAQGTPVNLGFFFKPADLEPYAVGVASLLIALALAVAVLRPALSRLGTLAAAAAVFVAAIVAIEVPHRAFPHYLTLAVFPCAAAIAAMMHAALSARAIAGTTLRMPNAVALFVVVAALVVPTLTVRAMQGSRYAYEFPTYGERGDPVVAALRQVAPAGSVMSIWGWSPEYYVDTETIMATKDANTLDDLLPGPYRDYYRRAFIADFRAHSPRVFVDAVSPAQPYFKDRVTQGYETFPELRELVARDYGPPTDVAGVRIFVLRAATGSGSMPRG